MALEPASSAPTPESWCGKPHTAEVCDGATGAGTAPARIGVGQRQVSKVERGDVDSAKIDTIHRYLEAVHGGLAIECVEGDPRVQVA